MKRIKLVISRENQIRIISEYLIKKFNKQTKKEEEEKNVNKS